MDVEHWDEARDGPFSEAALRARLEARGYRAARYVYPPGTVFPEHTHTVDKIDAVLSGRFRMTTPDGSVVLEAGGCLEVPRLPVEQLLVPTGSGLNFPSALGGLES